MTATLKEQLNSITPALREMQLWKEERVKQFQAMQNQIQRISVDIAGQSQCDEQPSKITINENDLSQKKLEEYQTELQRPHKEKLHHVGKVLTNLWSLMDTTYEDRQLFSHITGLWSVSSAEISTPGTLTLGIIQQRDEVKEEEEVRENGLAAREQRWKCGTLPCCSLLFSSVREKDGMREQCLEFKMGIFN
ncbi:hypothetical protein RHMOL_Rhmol06G0056800 [Rhododendron molle]|uniref:Uncharacterized protein n=1 Tax=Rhododendron molle TaxID=49168 RepID=A0ACC0NAE5_RHOML|nr:hypothetical protein RHMOL_Rhmol06G0056800 [Rhododendron molle]